MNSKGEPAFTREDKLLDKKPQQVTLESNLHPSKRDNEVGKNPWWDEKKLIIHMGPCR